MLLPLVLAASVSLPGPGLWELQSSLGGMGGKAEQKCLTSAEVERFLSDPSNRHYACDMSTREVRGGHIRLQGVCTSRKHAEQKINVSLTGDYTATTFALKGRGSAKVIGDLELPVPVAATGRRLAPDCSAPSSTPPPAAPSSEGGASPG